MNRTPFGVGPIIAPGFARNLVLNAGNKPGVAVDSDLYLGCGQRVKAEHARTECGEDAIPVDLPTTVIDELTIVGV